MDRVHVMALSRGFARKMIEMRDVIDGLAFIKTGRVMSTEELCEIGREAILLIERGEIK